MSNLHSLGVSSIKKNENLKSFQNSEIGHGGEDSFCILLSAGHKREKLNEETFVLDNKVSHFLKQTQTLLNKKKLIKLKFDRR